jgi:hypothetical protein
VHSATSMIMFHLVMEDSKLYFPSPTSGRVKAGKEKRELLRRNQVRGFERALDALVALHLREGR